VRGARVIVPVVLVAAGIAVGGGVAAAQGPQYAPQYTKTIYEGPYSTLADCQLDRSYDVHAEGPCAYHLVNPNDPGTGQPGYFYPTLI
jgi:hypothetical protein